ncbi:MAG: MFS transporter [Chloroflexi bacterium]|nr:MFS transporter [Chloroflexota bacterium]
MNSTATSTPVAWDPDTEPDKNYKWKAFSAIGLSMFTMVMSFSIVFVSLSAIADDYGVTLRAVTWVVVSQSLTISAIMLPLGRVADMVGRKRFHLTGQLIFIGGAIFAVFSPSLGVLIIARIVMAVGSSAGQAVGTAMTISVFPSNERGKAIGSQTTAVAIGAATGPIVGGLLLQWFPWQSLFIFMAIPTGIAFFMGLFILDESRVSQKTQGKRPKFDWIGAILSGASVVVLVVTINNPFAVAWISPLVVGGAMLVVALLVGFVAWELRNPAPMLDLRMFQERIFRLAVATRWIGFMGTTATQFMMPIFLISFRGFSEGLAGAVLFMSALGMAIAAQASGRLADAYGPRRFAVLGFMVIIVTALAFSTVDGGTPISIIMAIMFVNGIGMGLWNVPNNSIIMGTIPRARLGVISALTNLTRNIGNVTGQAIASAIVVGIMAADGFDIPLSEIADTAGAGDAFLSGWKVTYFAVVGFAVVGGALAFVTKPEMAKPGE